MARISVEQKALTDPRFDLLAGLMKSNRYDALGRMLLVWHECQEQSSYCLPERLVGAIFANRDGASWLVESHLAEWSRKAKKGVEGILRIKGTEGRIEWLAVKRERAKANGRRGGRPPANQSLTKEEPTLVTSGLTPETPLTPAPALAPALTEENTEELKRPATPVAASDGLSPKPAKKPRKEPDGVHAEFIRIFEDAWFVSYDAKYPFVGGKDGSAVKWFRDQVSDDVTRFREIVTNYFADRTPFIVDARHSMGNLRAQWARWAIRVPAGASRGGNVMDSFRATAEEFLRRGENVAS